MMVYSAFPVILLFSQTNFRAACQEVLEPVIEAVRELHPPKVWEDLSINLYTTFWVLSTYDVYVPAGRYEEEIGKAKQAIKDLETSSDLVSEGVRLLSI